MIVYDEKNDYWGFKENVGGLFNFEGIMANSKKINNIQVADNSVIVNYQDNNTYTATANVRNENNKKIISQITEKWNEQDINYDSAVEGIIAMMLFGASEKQETNHPDILEYKDNEYEPYKEIPEELEPEEDETFDSVIEKWKIDPETQEEFDSEKQYYIGDIVINNDKIYVCINDHLGIWSAADFKETEYKEVFWGIGILNKGESNEIVNRMIYPDFSEISLINFNGGGGLG